MDGKIKELLVYDLHPDSPRLMYEYEEGLYTYEQVQLLTFMLRIDKKLDDLLYFKGHING